MVNFISNQWIIGISRAEGAFKDFSAYGNIRLNMIEMFIQEFDEYYPEHDMTDVTANLLQKNRRIGVSPSKRGISVAGNTKRGTFFGRKGLS